jgi:leucyl aminopeptidase
MVLNHVKAKAENATPLTLVHKKALKTWLAKQSAPHRRWVAQNMFTGAPGTFCLLPEENGAIAGVVAGVAEKPDLWGIASLPLALPDGNYRLVSPHGPREATSLALGWALGTYEFTRYKKSTKTFATLVMPAAADAEYVETMAETVFLVRDMINTPTCDMLPSHFAAEATRVAKKYKAKITQIVGEDLLQENYPLIYAVGKASTDAPRLLDITWGNPKAPKVTLVGKGVCFDSGGLDLKSSSNMKLMKKDMAGAAIMLGLAQMVMHFDLPVRLRVLLPLVENAVAGNAMRPLDIVKSRKGLTVEIGNTDAEGRLILCDALTEADSEKPDLLIDVATLTGAARVALGLELPALFTPDDRLADGMARHAQEENDPLWRLPLWRNYRDMLNTSTSDISNDPDSSYAGAITAALYLQDFVSETKSWAHLDMMAWQMSSKPGRPSGGEAMGLRMMFALLRARYSKKRKA